MIQPDGQMTTALLLAVFIFLLLLAVLLILLAVILLIRRRRSEKERDEAWERMQTVVHVPSVDEDHTVDKWEPVPGAFGSFTVLYSDDRSKIGLHFDLTEPCTTLGRGKDNDIPFPKDSSVSRHHAKIEANKDGVYMSEVISVDGVKPRFGTFINQTRVMSDATDTPVIDGDTYFNEGDTKVSDASAAVTGVTPTEYTITIGAADVPAGAQTMSCELTPAAHTTDILYLTAFGLNTNPK